MLLIICNWIIVNIGGFSSWLVLTFVKHWVRLDIGIVSHTEYLEFKSDFLT